MKVRRLACAAALLACIALTTPASAENYPITFTGRILYRDIYGQTQPLSHCMITFWEDDTWDDDYLGSYWTDSEGRFSVYMHTTDQEGLTDPEYNVILQFWSHYARVGSTVLMPERVELAHNISPEAYVRPSGFALYDIGERVLDSYEGMRRWAGLLAIVHQTLSRLPPGFRDADVYCDPYTTTHCEPGKVFIGWNDWSNQSLIVSTLADCLLPRGNDYNNAPFPPGGGFTTVTNEAWAWDEGLKAFLKAVAMDDPIVPAMNLESGAVMPPSMAEGSSIAADVASSLWDLYDSGASPEQAFAPGFDQHNGNLDAMWQVLESGSIRSLAQFWSAWKAQGLPRHLPVLALRGNGVDYNTPPAWVTVDPLWVEPMQQVQYNIAPYVSDEESSDSEMSYNVVSLNSSGPVICSMSGPILNAYIVDPEPPGYAFLQVTANDGITSRDALVKLVIASGGVKDEDPGLDLAHPGSPEDEVAALALAGDTRMRGAGTFQLAIPRAGAARLTLHDVTGRIVRTLYEGSLPAGHHTQRWDGRSDAGARLPSGIYFANLEHEGARASLRLVLLR